jgi:hypothetical protein
MGLQFRRDTSANWSAVNPTLLSGEPAYELNTQTMRVGDGVTPYNNLPQFGAFPNAIAGGRLSLVQAAPVPDAWGPVSSQMSGSVLFYVPYISDRLSLWSGISWQPYTFNNTTRLELTGLAANKNYDIFAYQVNGTVTLTAVQWASNINRAVGLVLLNGVYVRSGQAAMRYLGTIRTTNTVGTTSDVLTRRFVYNHYNQVTRPMITSYGTTHTYSVDKWRIWNDNPADLTPIQFVLGFRNNIRADMHAYLRYGVAGLRLMPGVPYKTTLALAANPGDTAITVVYLDTANVYVGCALASAVGLATPSPPSVTGINGNTISLNAPVVSAMAAGTVVSFEPVPHILPNIVVNVVPQPALTGAAYVAGFTGGNIATLSSVGGFNSLFPCQSGYNADTNYGAVGISASTEM